MKVAIYAVIMFMFSLIVGWSITESKSIEKPKICSEEIKAMETICQFKEGKACDAIQLIYLNCLVRKNAIQLNKENK